MPDKKNSLKREIRKILSTALITAFSLLVALTWKDLIEAYATEISHLSPIQGQLVTAIAITIIGTISILFITHYFKKE